MRTIRSGCVLLTIGIIVLMSQNVSAGKAGPVSIVAADIESFTTIRVQLEKPVAPQLSIADIRIQPPVEIRQISHRKDVLMIVTDSLDLHRNYTISIAGSPEKPLRHMGILDLFYSEKPLGYQIEGERTVFRVFSPRATKVEMELFRTCDQAEGERYSMTRDQDGVWELVIDRNLSGYYYGYRVHGPQGPGEMFNPEHLIADPYSRAVCTRNHYLHQGKTLILEESFDWEDDDFLGYKWEDLIILEAHVRDLTAHPSTGLPDSLRGTYLGLIQPGTPGGINYLKDLGVNAVEFLPIHDFGNIEVPYKDPSAPVYNDWNPYARNHWGYMTSYFFAPESYYATGASLEPGGYCGVDGRAVREFKQVVKTLHQNGIAVILDVVYNHVAQYDQNSFKHLDKKYYFRLDPDLNFESRSWCGNDFKTERPMARRLIVESVLYWMKEYHVDGFRFDLAALIDWETIDLIRKEATKINPNVILIAEAWGGGEYELAEFSRRGWAAWNDQIRNGIKGQNPRDGLGFIFGQWQGRNNYESIKNYFYGTLAQYGGLFVDKSHSVNYLESHDDHTLGDFIRLGLRDVDEEEVIEDVDRHARLTARQLKYNRLAALCLLVSQGPIMLSQGQDWARSKVIAPTDAPDPRIGKIDHNSYEKDNETNWLNWEHRKLNQPLVDYYKGLIALRKAHPIFRHARPENFHFFPIQTPFAVGFHLKKKGTGDKHDFVVLINANPQQTAVFSLPPGNWEVVVDATRAGTKGLLTARGGMNIVVPPTSGMVFRQLRAKR